MSAPDAFVPLAQMSEAPKLFDQSQRIHSPVWTVIGYLVVIAVLVIIAAVLVRRLYRLLTRPQPHLQLFVQLTHVHELSDLEVRTLRRIWRREGIDNPARLFVDRAILRKELNMLHDPIVAGLYGKLFGS